MKKREFLTADDLHFDQPDEHQTSSEKSRWKWKLAFYIILFLAGLFVGVIVTNQGVPNTQEIAPSETPTISSEYPQEVLELKRQIDELEGQVDVLQGQLKEATTQQNTLQSQVENYEKQLAALESNLASTPTKTDATSPQDHDLSVPPASSTTSTSEHNEPRDIKASVSFDGTQFTITNNENQDWTNVRFEVNAGAFSSGYTYKVQEIKPGVVYTVGAMQFANSKGERFNPFLKKPTSFNILEFARPWPDQYDIEGMATFGWQ